MFASRLFEAFYLIFVYFRDPRVAKSGAAIKSAHQLKDLHEGLWRVFILEGLIECSESVYERCMFDQEINNIIIKNNGKFRPYRYVDMDALPRVTRKLF